MFQPPNSAFSHSFLSPKLFLRCRSGFCLLVWFYDALLVSPVVYVFALCYWNMAWCQVENMNGLDASLLSSMAFRNPLQGKVKVYS